MVQGEMGFPVALDMGWLRKCCLSVYPLSDFFPTAAFTRDKDNDTVEGKVL